VSVDLSREEMLLVIRALEEQLSKGLSGHTAVAIEALLKKLVPYVGSQPGFRPADGKNA
jgi:hypothetical protein